MSDVEGDAENIKVTLIQDPSDLAESEDGKYSEVVFYIFKVCLKTPLLFDIIKPIMK